MTRHVRITRRDEPICDFCEGGPVTHRFPCSQDIYTCTETRNGPIHVHGVGDWAACAACAPLVRAKDPAALTESIIARSAEVQAIASVRPDVVETLRRHLHTLYVRVLPVLGEPTTHDARFTSEEQRQVEIQIVEDGE